MDVYTYTPPKNPHFVDFVQNPDGTESLYCRGNNIKLLPNDIVPESTRIFDCSLNCLTFLPRLPTNLTKLYCSGNKLVELPELPRTLKVLHCYRNNLKRLPKLPSGLSILFCYCNELTELPYLPDTLTLLYCNGNNIDSFKNIPSSISYILSEGNRFRKNEENENHFPSLFELVMVAFGPKRYKTFIDEVDEKLNKRKKCGMCKRRSTPRNITFHTTFKSTKIAIKNRFCCYCVRKQQRRSTDVRAATA